MNALPQRLRVGMLLLVCHAHAQAWAPEQQQPATVPAVVTYIVLAIMALVAICLIVSTLVVLRWIFRLLFRLIRPPRPSQPTQQNDDLGDVAAQFILIVAARAASGWSKDEDRGRDNGRPDTVPDNNDDVSGDGGTFDGGGASGDWDD